ncbi:HNH endonuclease [Ensifer sp. Root954]|uniref:HNH endonuclease n=1 Tax=Ensifer sp. Root954 TaxID=1736611 RepID=UPI0007145A70|nr:HNH endonuclease [Ensifer sp. Root954]KRD56985.1 endonuclease [Ensifer sp. Root954]
MAKLTTLKPRLATLAPRLGLAKPTDRKEAEAQRLKQRDQEQPWRKWYYTRRWKKLREQVLLRDGYTCQKTGVICVGKHPEGNSPVVDHKTPHRGVLALFWDIDNLETLSKAYHDREKQKAERGARW